MGVFRLWGFDKVSDLLADMVMDMDKVANKLESMMVGMEVDMVAYELDIGGAHGG